MTQSPCRNCLDRTITCHSMCRRYREWKSVHEAELERARQVREDNLTSRVISEPALRKYWRSLRYSRASREKR